MRLNSDSVQTAQTVSELKGTWYEDEQGFPRSLQFVVSPPAQLAAETCQTFSSIFQNLARKFKEQRETTNERCQKIFSTDKENFLMQESEIETIKERQRVAKSNELLSRMIAIPVASRFGI